MDINIEPPVTVTDEGPNEAEVHGSRLARLRAIQAAKDVADQWGFTVSDEMARHAKMAVDEVLLPVAWEHRDMIDAAEYLRRRGHGEGEIRQLAPEFGRCLKAAKEHLTGTARHVQNLNNDIEAALKGTPEFATSSAKKRRTACSQQRV
jgi:hypothetical protein